MLGCALAYHWGGEHPNAAQAQTVPKAQLFLPLVLQHNPPQPDYEFNVGLVGHCDPNAAITYVNGTTARAGVAVNGALVAFS